MSETFDDIHTAPVGSYPAGASPYGVLDMAGNVWEWVADWYSSDYYALSPNNNPLGPKSGETRVLRGGYYNANWNKVRSAYRGHLEPNKDDWSIGFRCAFSP